MSKQTEKEKPVGLGPEALQTAADCSTLLEAFNLEARAWILATLFNFTEIDRDVWEDVTDRV